MSYCSKINSDKLSQELNKPPLILIVDDYIQNVQVLAQNLEACGYDIAIGRNGEEALALVEKVRPDMILLDVMMPDMSGFQVCERLRADKQNSDIPVVFLTAKTESEDVSEGFQCGGSDYIHKPFSAPELLARVRLHLELCQLKKIISYGRSLVCELQALNSESKNEKPALFEEIKRTLSY